MYQLPTHTNVDTDTPLSFQSCCFLHIQPNALGLVFPSFQGPTLHMQSLYYVRCLHDRARGIISTQDNLQKEVDHLARVLKQNGYPANFIRNASAPPTQETADVSSPEEEQEKGPLVVIPYVAGMSEDIRCVCRKFNIRVVFKSGRTLRSMLTKAKDTLPTGKQSNVHGISYPLQLRPSLHRRDQTETGDEAEGTPRCLREGDDGEVSCSGTCVGAPPPDPLGEDHRTGPWQRTGVVEGGLAHPDDTCGRALQPRWRTGSPWLLDRCDEEREEQSSPTFDLQ